MDQTRAAMADKIHALEEMVLGSAQDVVETAESVTETVQDSVQMVKKALDVPSQVRQHPWAAVGVSVLVGFVGGTLLMRGRRRKARRAARRHRSVYAAQTTNGHGNGRATATPPSPSRTESTGDSWLSKLGETLSGPLSHLKGLALGATFGVVRDMFTRSAPEALKPRLTEVIDDITTKMGGQPVEGPVLQDADSSSSHQDQGDYYGQSHQTEMGRPMGSA
jgi:ElaB/YqjD/DUF883 family membrane-anchored ribosome-binding protein